MSWDTQSWAGKVKPGSASEKLVLLGLAQCSDANHCAHPSIEWLCDFSDLNRKTVILAISRLEEKDLIRDTGRRVGRTGKVKVYRLGAGRSADPESNGADFGTVTKSEQFQNRNGSDFSAKQSQNRDAEPFREHNTPPTPPSGGDDGVSKRSRGSRIAEDWTPPAIADLPPQAANKARQWPAGAYEAEAEAFRNYWLGEGRAGACKADWNRTWYNRINEITARVLRDARNGVKLAGTAAQAPARPPVMLDTSREGKPAAMIRTAIEKRIGAALYARWIAPSRIDVAGEIVTVVSPSAFDAAYVRDNFQNDIAAAVGPIIGADVDVQFRNERPPE